jgi:hypothetical protein
MLHTGSFTRSTNIILGNTLPAIHGDACGYHNFVYSFVSLPLLVLISSTHLVLKKFLLQKLTFVYVRIDSSVITYQCPSFKYVLLGACFTKQKLSEIIQRYSSISSKLSQQ